MDAVPQTTIQGGNPQMMAQLQQDAYNKALEEQGLIVPRFNAPEILNLLNSTGLLAAIRCEGHRCEWWRHDRDGEGYCGSTSEPGSDS